MPPEEIQELETMIAKLDLEGLRAVNDMMRLMLAEQQNEEIVLTTFPHS
jgi:hypothetical protein